MSLRTIVRAAGAMGALVALSLACGCERPEPTVKGEPAPSTESPSQEPTGMASSQTSDAPSPSIHQFTMNRIDGSPESLAAYEGKVVLVVNVASKCGLTPQYAGLEKLYEEKSGEGFVVLGFPANNFMGQEPGSNEQILSFCRGEYGVTFPMFEKISVKGKDQAALFAMLSSESEEPSWNFTKYLVGPDGRLVKRFGPRTAPDDAELRAEIDRLLSEGGAG